MNRIARLCVCAKKERRESEFATVPIRNFAGCNKFYCILILFSSPMRSDPSAEKGHKRAIEKTNRQLGGDARASRVTRDDSNDDNRSASNVFSSDTKYHPLLRFNLYSRFTGPQLICKSVTTFIFVRCIQTESGSVISEIDFDLMHCLFHAKYEFISPLFVFIQILVSLLYRVVTVANANIPFPGSARDTSKGLAGKY